MYKNLIIECVRRTFQIQTPLYNPLTFVEHSPSNNFHNRHCTMDNQFPALRLALDELKMAPMTEWDVLLASTIGKWPQFIDLIKAASNTKCSKCCCHFLNLNMDDKAVLQFCGSFHPFHPGCHETVSLSF